MEPTTRKILTLCIPTYQRASYLRDLLVSIEISYRNVSNPTEIDILIADNASQDETKQVVAEFQKRLPIQYQQNAANIGADRNFHHLVKQVKSDYFWLIGDDETLAVEALNHVLTLLQTEQPNLLILRSFLRGKDWYEPDVELPFVFENYQKFVAYYATRNVWPVLGHSLISLNIVKLSCFDLCKQEQILETMDVHYAHMYGLVSGLKKDKGKVMLDALPVVLIRDRRAPVDMNGLVTLHLWSRYLTWVGEEFNQPPIVRYGRRMYGPGKKFKAWRRRLWANIKTWFT
ncbi:MAG: glycosyltransferase family 2 protein [Verrucomicrobiota bacterium]